jgi:hypothetical protein
MGKFFFEFYHVKSTLETLWPILPVLEGTQYAITAFPLLLNMFLLSLKC